MMDIQYFLLTVVVLFALYCAYLSTKSIFKDIKRLGEEDQVQLSRIGEILAQEALDYLENQEMVESYLHEGGYDESKSYN